jgi:hypothetical protein
MSSTGSNLVFHCEDRIPGKRDKEFFSEFKFSGDGDVGL